MLAVTMQRGAYLRSRPWFCQMFSIILIICSVSMSCLRSAEARGETKRQMTVRGLLAAALFFDQLCDA